MLKANGIFPSHASTGFGKRLPLLGWGLLLALLCLWLPTAGLAQTHNQERVQDYLDRNAELLEWARDLVIAADFNHLFMKMAELLKIDVVFDAVNSEKVESIDTALQEKFRKKMDIVKQELKEALIESNLKEIASLAHKHKSSSGMVGYMEISNLFSNLEKAAASGNKNLCENLLQKLNEEFKLF